MSQFTGLLSATGLGSIRNLGVVVSDVTPNAVDWNDVVSSVSVTTNTVTITGINTAINLSISASYIGGGFKVYINNNEFTIDDDGYTVSVSNNDEVYFNFSGSSGEETTISVTVRNASDGNTVLDTFTMTAFQGGGGGG
jgi:hypothetical protein